MKKTFILLSILLSSFLFSSCNDDDNDENFVYDERLIGDWTLVNIAADVTAGDDMEKADVSIDLVNTSYPKVNTVYTFNKDGSIKVITHKNEGFNGKYTFKDDILNINIEGNTFNNLPVWISGNVMRVEEDITKQYVYDDTPYPTVSKVLKIYNLVKK